MSVNKILFIYKTYLQAHRASRCKNLPDKLRSIRILKMQKLINYSYRNIKYYREIFDSVGVKPEDIKTIEDIKKIPITTKQDLRTRFWDFLPKKLPECRVSRTSGSTGIPVCILSDANSRLHNSAAVIRSRLAMGVPLIGKPILALLKNKTEPIYKPSHWTYLQGIHKTYYLNPYIDSDENIEHVDKILKILKSPAILAITPAVRMLAEKIKDHVYIKPDKPCCISTWGDTLTSQTRHIIESVFGVVVTDNFGCNEMGEIAWQCKQAKGYHINMDNVILEVLKDGKDSGYGNVGEAVVTNLNRYAMPFIRFAIGDLVKLSTEKCPCGCKLPILSEIVGRSGQDVKLPDGKIVPWNHLKGFMNHPDIRQFQLVQNKDASLTIKFIPEQKYSIEQTKKILATRFKGVLGNSIGIEFSVVEKIDPAPSGKSKLVICHYAP